MKMRINQIKMTKKKDQIKMTKKKDQIKMTKKKDQIKMTKKMEISQQKSQGAKYNFLLNCQKLAPKTPSLINIELKILSTFQIKIMRNSLSR
jgi:primase-polymerase (primpol)-like protein